MSLDIDTGYVIDTEYTRHAYNEMAPAHIAYVCAIRGHELTLQDLDRGFDYCELGCGAGMTSLTMAAGNPRGRFVAVDLNPSHIARANRLADRGGVRNIRYIESTFGDLLDRSDLPEFDVIALHGVYSWIGPEHRRQVVEFIRRRLRAGGVVFVSYNTLPGWSSMAPLRKLMIERTQHLEMSSVQKAKVALEFLKELVADNGLYVQEAKRVPSFVERLGNHPLAYIVHEYLNKDWEPHYSADVAREMQYARLTYVGEGEIKLNYPELVLPKPIRDRIAKAATPIMGETLRDFSLNTMFRRDIFVRGGAALPVPERMPLFQRLRFVALKHHVLPEKIKIGGLEMKPTPSAQPIFEAAHKTPISLDDLSRITKDGSFNPNDVFTTLQLLVAADLLQVAVQDKYGWSGSTAPQSITFSPLNMALLGEAATHFDTSFLSAPVLGSSIQVAPLHTLLLWATVTAGPAKALDVTWDTMAKRGAKLNEKDKKLETKEDHLPALERARQDMMKAVLPNLLRAGVAIGA